jgi:F-type H+-transporting ATPase subunit b
MLSLDLATIVFQLINFVVLAAVLNRVLFQPILRRAAERTEEKERLIRELAEERQAVAALRASLEQQQAQLEEEKDQRIARIHEEAESDRRELLKDARTEAEKLLAEAQADSYRLQQQAMDDFHERLVRAIMDISGTIIGRVAPPAVHDALVQGLSERIREMGRSEMERVEAVRHSLGDREALAHVASARELSGEQQAQLARTLTALADRHVNIQLRIAPDLVAGLQVRLGDTVIDNSLAGQLEELRQQASVTLREQVNSA